MDSQASEELAPDSRGGVSQQMAHQGAHRVEGEAAAEVDPTERTTLAGHESLLFGGAPPTGRGGRGGGACGWGVGAF